MIMGRLDFALNENTIQLLSNNISLKSAFLKKTSINYYLGAPTNLPVDSRKFDSAFLWFNFDIIEPKVLVLKKIKFH